MIDILQAICASDRTRNQTLAEPFVCTDAENTWTVASDRRVACAVRAVLTVRTQPNLSGWDTIFRLPGHASFTVTGERFWAWAKAPEPPIALPPCTRCDGSKHVRCPDCKGEGQIDCECSDCGDQHLADCENCDASSHTVPCKCDDPPPPRLGRVGGKVFVDRNLFAAFVGALPTSTSVNVYVVDVITPVRFWTDAWRVIVMPFGAGSEDL